MRTLFNEMRMGNPWFLPQVRVNSMSGRGRFLGQAPAEWYRRAKAALARFEGLVARSNQIANRTSRENILAWVGDSANPATPAYRYATVLSDVSLDVERYTPPNVDAYQVERRQKRVTALEEINSEFNDRVGEAERVYGVLPAPVQLPGTERIVTVPGAAGPNLTLPILIGAGAIAAAVLLF